MKNGGMPGNCRTQTIIWCQRFGVKLCFLIVWSLTTGNFLSKFKENRIKFIVLVNINLYLCVQFCNSISSLSLLPQILQNFLSFYSSFQASASTGLICYILFYFLELNRNFIHSLWSLVPTLIFSYIWHIQH